jgi:hypothetical protein
MGIVRGIMQKRTANYWIMRNERYSQLHTRDYERGEGELYGRFDDWARSDAVTVGINIVVVTVVVIVAVALPRQR